MRTASLQSACCPQNTELIFRGCPITGGAISTCRTSPKGPGSPRDGLFRKSGLGTNRHAHRKMEPLSTATDSRWFRITNTPSTYSCASGLPRRRAGCRTTSVARQKKSSSFLNRSSTESTVISDRATKTAPLGRSPLRPGAEARP